MAEEGPDKMGGGCGNDGQCGNFLNIFLEDSSTWVWQ